MKAPLRPAPGRWLALPLIRWSAGIVACVIGGIVAFEMMDISIFKRIGMAHEFCYQREPRLIWLHVISDLIIGTAYVTISATLGYLVYKASRGIPFNWVFLAFGLFIISCGLTHFMEVWVIWEPVYWMSGYVKVVTAAASMATAVALFPLLPKVFRLIESARQSEYRRVEIEQLNEELERFNYSVAHDLRAPLRGISGFSQALREDHAAELSADAQRYLDRIQASVGKMDALIADLLKYASIGRKDLQLRPVSVESALHATLAFMDAEIREREAEIIVTSALPTVVADTTLLQVIFQNLIGNAIKFVAPGVQPRVEIGSPAQAGGHARIWVTDNGVGIPAESRQRIFGIFERFHPEYEGTGIGLPIVQRAVERLGGRLGFESAPTGTGTRFWVELPLADPAGARE